MCDCLIDWKLLFLLFRQKIAGKVLLPRLCNCLVLSMRCSEQQWPRRSQVLECVIVHAVQHASPIAEKDIGLTCAADRNFFLTFIPEKQDSRNGLRSTGGPRTGWARFSVSIFWPNHFIHLFFFSGFVLLFSLSGYCEHPWNGQQHSWRLSSACGLSSSGGQHIV